MTKMNRLQREALFKVFQRDWPRATSPWRPTVIQNITSIPWRKFRKTVSLYPDGSGCVMVPWKGMWLGIERDGYTHS